ncbi:MAG: oligosaccharide flippase family protein [Saccharofermentanales bacterium]
MKHTIGSDAVKLTASKFVTMAISMISAMLLSRFRTLQEYGTYSQLLLVVNLITTIFMLGLPNSINFFLAREEDKLEKQKFLSVYYTMSTVLSMITGLVLVLSTPLIVRYFDNPMIRNFLYVFAIYPWAKIVLSSIDNVLINYRRTTIIMIFRISNSVSLLLLLVIVGILDLNFTTYMLFFILIESLFALSVYVISKRMAGHLQINLDRIIIRKILKFSIPLGLASVIGVLSIELDKLLIGRFFSTEDLAIYTNAAKEMPVTIVAGSITAVLMPQLVRLLKENRNTEAVRMWNDSVYISYAIICICAIGLFVFAPEAISLLYSERYLPGVSVFRVYNLVLLLRFTYFGMILNSIGKTKFIFYSSLASLGLNVVLNYFLYLAFGFIGPAIASFIALSVVALFQLIATSKNIGVAFTHILPWRDIAYITLLNAVFGGFFFLLKYLLPLEVLTGSIIESIIMGALWCGIYYFVLKKKLKMKWHSLNGANYL